MAFELCPVPTISMSRGSRKPSESGEASGSAPPLRHPASRLMSPIQGLASRVGFSNIATTTTTTTIAPDPSRGTYSVYVIDIVQVV